MNLNHYNYFYTTFVQLYIVKENIIFSDQKKTNIVFVITVYSLYYLRSSSNVAIIHLKRSFVAVAT